MPRNLHQTPNGNCVYEPLRQPASEGAPPALNPRHKVNNQQDEDAYLKGLKRPGGRYEDGRRAEGQQKQQAHAKHDRRDPVGRDDNRVMRPGIRADRLDSQRDHCMPHPCSRCKQALVLAENDSAPRTPLGVRTGLNWLSRFNIIAVNFHRHVSMKLSRDRTTRNSFFLRTNTPSTPVITPVLIRTLANDQVWVRLDFAHRQAGKQCFDFKIRQGPWFSIRAFGCGAVISKRNTV